MCGIAGIYNFDLSVGIDIQLLNNMSKEMAHRGPDGKGSIILNHVGLAHRRLSIIDLSSEASQPFVSTNNRYSIVYNGEIFNYIELKQILLSKGYVFRTKSDTEVLLCMYQEYGESMLEQLNGMFAFAIYDSLEKTMFIARDRIGIKPFYYSLYQNALYFASEPKSIIAAGVPNSVFKEGIHELLLFRYISGENTIFKYIKRLLPGHSMVVKIGKQPFIKRWWNLKEKILTNRENLPNNPFEWFEETLYSSVNFRTISDVPVGIMLSGGLDSGALAVALAKNGHTNISAFTVAFEEKEYNEGHLARKVANQFGLKYHEIKVTGDELDNSLQKAAWFHDEPLIHQNDAQMLSLAYHAKKHVSVLLSGEGGDEFMGGYVRYKPLNHFRLLQSAGKIASILKLFNNGQIVNRYDKLERYAQNKTLRDLVLLNATNVYPNDLKKLGVNIDMESFEYRNKMYEESLLIYPNEPSRQAMYLDLFTHMASVLDRNDRMTMGAGIECRVPFMDYRLMEIIPAFPSKFLLKGKKGKFLLFNSLAQKLPKEVLSFKKLGFSVPWEKYFNSNEVFKEFINDFAKNDNDVFFDRLNKQDILNNFKKGDSTSIALIRQLFMFELWKKAYNK
jgi:asparagine synthase (glutamine-hydrolysing)